MSEATPTPTPVPLTTEDLQFAKDLSHALWERSILRHGMFTPPQFAALCEAAIVDFLTKRKSV